MKKLFYNLTLFKELKLKLCFIDETSDKGKNGDYFAICAALINAKIYCELKKAALEIFKKYDWDLNNEFKGSIIFDPDVDDFEKERRFTIAHEILSLNKAKSNSKVKFVYVSTKLKEVRKSYYLKCLPILVETILPKATSTEISRHKNLLGLYCDHLDDITSQEIEKNIVPILDSMNYCMIEEPVLISHGTKNIGTLFADLFAYFAGRLHINGKELQNISISDVDELVNTNIFKSVVHARQIISSIKSYKLKKIDPDKAGSP